MKILKIKKIEKLNETKKVYDFAVKDTHHYILSNGLISHNSFVGGNEIGGGSGSLYNSSIIIEFTKAQEKGSDGKTSGALVSSNTTKCRTAKEKTKIKFSIDFESGLGRYSGLQLFCEDEKLIVKEGRSFKINDKVCGPISLSVGEVFSTTKMNDKFWDEFLEKFLAEYLRNKFKYKGVSDDVLDSDDDDENDQEPELLLEEKIGLHNAIDGL